MKTSEFIEEIKKLGYIVDDESSNKSVYVCDEEYNALAMVNIKEMYTVDTYWDEFRRLSNENKRCLLNVVLEYIKTPIADREEEKLYLLSLPNCSYASKYLEINIDNQKEYRIKTKPKTSEIKVTKNNTTREVKRFQMVFTKSEIKELDNQRFIQSLHTEYFKQ